MSKETGKCVIGVSHTTLGLLICCALGVLLAVTACTAPSQTAGGTGGGDQITDGDASQDTDEDGVPDASDNCPNVPNADQVDSDDDTVGDVCDDCPQDANKTDPGECGCGLQDTGSDGDRDGVADCIDNCPADPGKSNPGECGCGVADDDSDGDGAPDCDDECPGDSNKTEPGACGCGVTDDDSDGDGAPDCDDECPGDSKKTEPGECGCGVTDDDSDGDGVLDCNDECPDDSNKSEPGACGCGVADDDADGDGLADCLAGLVEAGVGHDGIVLGKTSDEIIAILGPPDVEEPQDDLLWLNWRATNGIDVLFAGDPPSAIEIRYNPGSDLTLTTGPGIGTPREDVFAVFGDPVEVRQVESNEGLFGDRVLYELTNGASKIIYKDEGVLFWFDDEGAISQFVVFPIG